MAYINRGGESQNANSHTTFTSTTTWNTWLLSIEVSGATKAVKGYRDHNRNGWFDGGLNSYRNTYTGRIGSVTPLFIGSSPGFQYAGDIADIIIYPRQLSPTEIDDVFTAMDTTYYLTCPALSAVNGTNGDVAAGKAFCSGVDARMGNECQQACNTGLVRTYGTLNHMCQVGEWTGSNLVCERECPPLSPPLYFSTCARTLLAKAMWISDAADLDVGLWALSPPVPRSERPNYWTVNAATGLLTTAAGTAPCAVGSPSLLYMMTPRWADLVLATMRTMVSVVVTPTSGVLGVAFRAADSSNYYLLQLGVAPAAGGAGWAALIRYKTGQTPLTFANVSVPFYSAGRAVPVNVSMQGAAFDVTLGGATVIAGAMNGDLSYGGIGVYSAGVGAFGALSVTTECDSGGSCTLATPGSSCAFTCATGYVLVAGSASRTCSAMADGSSLWSGQSAVCSLTPPTFANTSTPLLVAENSPQDTNVGQPIVAITSAARVSIIYSILAEYPPPLDPALPRFGIGACSGQVFVLSTNSTLDYETQVSGQPPGSWWCGDHHVNGRGDSASELCHVGSWFDIHNFKRKACMHAAAMFVCQSHLCPPCLPPSSSAPCSPRSPSRSRPCPTACCPPPRWPTSRCSCSTCQRRPTLCRPTPPRPTAALQRTRRSTRPSGRPWQRSIPMPALTSRGTT
jgi:hypothetical protein